jgi:hypothetical protein
MRRMKRERGQSPLVWSTLSRSSFESEIPTGTQVIRQNCRTASLCSLAPPIHGKMVPRKHRSPVLRLRLTEIQLALLLLSVRPISNQRADVEVMMRVTKKGTVHVLGTLETDDPKERRYWDAYKARHRPMTFMLRYETNQLIRKLRRALDVKYRASRRKGGRKSPLSR